MKKMRKIFAVLLTLAMVLGMSMTSCRIFRNRPAGLVEVSADIVVGVKADHARHGAVEKVLCFHYLKLLIRQFFFLLLFSSHLFSPPNQIRFLPQYRESHHPKCLFRNTEQSFFSPPICSFFLLRIHARLLLYPLG